MAYTEYIISVPASSDYGTYTKHCAEQIADTIPWLSIETVVTDTASTYSAIFAISGCNYLKMRIRNSSSIAYVGFGNNFNGSSGTDYSEGSKALGSAGATFHFVVSDKVLFYMASSSVTWMAGRLTSIVDGSEIEVWTWGALNSSTSNRMATSATTSISFVASAPSMASTQIQSIPSNTYFLAEYFISPNSVLASKAPYVVNGHGPYYIVCQQQASLPSGTILSNGTDTFIYTFSQIAYRL